MASITTRAGKGSPLTNAELDANFNNINAQLSTAVITGGTIDGATIGATTATTGKFSQLDVDNLRLDANTITSTDTNGNITITPNGTGSVAISKLSVTGVATLAAGAVLGTPSSGTVTNLTGTASININGTVGATTASTGAFTTLSATGATPVVTVTSTGTTASSQDFTTNGAAQRTTIGVEQSTGGGLFVGSTAYAAVFGSAGASNTQFATNNTVRATIDTSGNLGIGTSSPAFKVDISGGGTTAKFNTLDTNDGGASLSTWQKVGRRAGTGTNVYINTLHSGSDAVSALTWAFGTSGTGTEVMRLDSSGNVGIGTSSPAVKLDVVGAISATGNLTSSGANGALVLNTSAFQIYKTGNDIRVYTESVDRAKFNSSGLAVTGDVSATGNLGIGTSSPAAKLHIAVASAAVDGTKGVRITNPAGTIVVLECGSVSDSYVGSTTSNFSIRAGNVECAHFTTGGQTLINSTTDAAGSGARLHITGASSQSACSIKIGTDSYPGWYFVNSAGTNVGTISINTASTAYNTSSDYRLKNTIASMTGALAKVAQLKPVTYKWNINGSDGEGFIAHELAEVCPHAVSGEKDAVETQQYEISPAVPATFDEDGTILTPAVEAVMGEREVPKYQGIDTSFLVATLTAAIQEQQALITQLTARITALETA